MTEKEAEDLCRMIRVGVDLSKPKYNYHPKTKDELKDLIEELLKKRGNKADLNDIDVSKITDMSEVFKFSQFNGNISKWNVSKVKDMWEMFYDSEFNGDISKWDVSSVRSMSFIFATSRFNRNISDWDVSRVMLWMVCLPLPNLKVIFQNGMLVGLRI